MQWLVWLLVTCQFLVIEGLCFLTNYIEIFLFTKELFFFLFPFVKHLRRIWKFIHVLLFYLQDKFFEPMDK